MNTPHVVGSTARALWWGTYPAAGLGTQEGLGEGIWLGVDGAPTQVLELPAPSFVLAHPDMPLVYAVTEADPSIVHAIDVSDPTAPVVAASLVTGGHAGCHLLLSPDALTLYVSHYMSGDVGVVELLPNGLFAADAPAQMLGHEGSGARPDRQEAPHAHSAGFAPGGEHLLVADLGTDELRRYVVQPNGSLVADGIAATLAPGAGPRHFAVRGNLIYVVCELDHQLRTLRWDSATASADVIAEVASTTAPHRTGDEVNDGHLQLVGDVLLVSVRGADVISVFDLSPEGEARYRGCFDAGFWPRYFAVIDENLWVGEERGHHVRRFDLADVLALAPEAAVGEVSHVAHRSYPVTSPACVVATSRK
ncbi:lactonase family protein [Demequina aurantiaca]|uniref:lactonase family protein n=1 Tax=Demequina aurantiaca TaxID=676200 RepID=UPI000784F74D|nr:beta-propeller fold lactonase family protein [Demequina aurantiaca]